MDFTFSEEHEMLRDMTRKFVENEVKPLARQIDEEERIPPELMGKLREQGFFGIPFSEEYGGVGAGETGYCIVLEEMGRGSASVAVLLAAHTSIGVMGIYLDGTEEQKKKYLPELCSGEKIAAFALTEPGAGSDAAAIATTAVPDGDDYVLNGSKLYITNGDIADVVTVFAVTDKGLGVRGGITAFIVESSMPGFSRGPREKKMGIRGSGTCELFFKDMRVPKANVIGKVGLGFVTAMKTLDVGRLSLGGACVGACKELIDLSIQHASQRVQFGEPIIRKQAIQWMLAEMAGDTFAMESMVYRAAWMCDQGLKVSRESAIVKMVSSETLDRVVDKAVQIHGGMGYMQDYPIEMMYRDARINRIFEGTNEVQRMVIAGDLTRKGRY
jgi:acyl-CoA dehydrogenase